MDTNIIPTTRPKNVQLAVTILYVTLGLGVISGVLQMLTHARSIGVGGVVSRMFTTLVVFVVMAFVVMMVGRGRNWARMALVVLFLVGVLPSIIPLIRFFATHPISGLLGLAQLVLQIAAFVFLFQPDSSQWFRENPAT